MKISIGHAELTDQNGVVSYGGAVVRPRKMHLVVNSVSMKLKTRMKKKKTRKRRIRIN